MQAYGHCLESASEFKITAVKPAPPLDEQLLGLQAWVFSTAASEAIEAMNGQVMAQGAAGPVKVQIRAYRDAKSEPFGAPER